MCSRMVMRCNSNQWETPAAFSEIYRNTFLFSLWCETNRPCCGFSVAQPCPTLCDPVDCSTPGLFVPHHLPKFAQVHTHCIGDAVQPSPPLTPSSPSVLIFPSIRDFSIESSIRIRWTKSGQMSFSFSISPSSEYSGLIYLKINWFDLALQGTFRSLLQHHSLKAFLTFYLLYSPTFTTISDHWEDYRLDYTNLCQQSNVSTFQHIVYICYCFPAKKQLSFYFMASVTIGSDFGAQEKEICYFHLFFHSHTSTFSPSIGQAVVGPDAMILAFFFFNI